jgi:hypothetical protein
VTLSLIGMWHRNLRRFGPLGIAAGFFAAGALALAAWIPQLYSQDDELRTTLKKRATQAPTLVPAANVQSVPEVQQIGEFIAAFPPMSQNSSDLNEIFQSAKRRNIQLARGEYQLKDDANTPLVVLIATFPVSAGYGPTKEFTADVLRALPHVSLDELRMTRSAAGVSALESSIRFSLVYRRP